MLSDDSSSDSETGRFKCRSKPENDQASKKKDDNLRSFGRSRNTENEKFRREFDRKKEDRERFEKYSRDRNKYSRYSPVNRRRQSRERSPKRRSYDRRHSRERSPNRSLNRPRHSRNSRERSKPRDHRSSSKDRHRHSRSRSHKSTERKKDLKEEIPHTVTPQEKPPDKFNRRARESISLSPDNRAKRSEVYKPPPSVPVKRKSDSPIIVEEHNSGESEEVQPGSYYSMIPAIVKEKSEESSEIDSSDDEKLRAKLLNLEKKLHKTKKKKHRKKHRRKTSKEQDQEMAITVEVSSTTDIPGEANPDLSTGAGDVVPEVTSTQKSAQKESSEEGEILSDDDNNQNKIEIDASDLRHKLLHSGKGSSQKSDVCGPALPPHLQGQHTRSDTPDVEGPILPPHLQRGPKNIGPSIPEEMRKVLAENDRKPIKYVSSDEDVGIGPLPVGAEEKWSDAHKHLEERALKMKIKQLDGYSMDSQKVKSREQWMLELPEGKAKYLGLEARGFRPKEGPDMSDRSTWTDTPEEKAQKAVGIVKEEDADVALRRDARSRQIANRDEEQESAVKKHKKKHKRDESLLEMHEKKLKKKKKKEEKEDGKKERRPFSRDVDLQVNRFDDAQKRSIIKKAQDLDGRFSKGEAKYL